MLTLEPRVGQEHFAACVAHELRTPLSTQRSLLELMLADTNADTATWREVGEDVLDACRRQERALDACLALARSQSRLERREPLDLSTIAGDAFGAHDSSDLDSAVMLEPAWTAGDPDLVERLASNLVSNAIRHNIAGGRLEISTRVELGQAHLSVVNTGPVIPSRDLPRLFLPFQRCVPRPRVAAGLGLGLAIVKAVADAHDATVRAYARGGGGLGIDVAFPALD